MLNKLEDYGYNFQIKSIVLYMTDNDFTAQVLDILDPTAYQSESTKWIAKHCKDYYTEYKKTINFESFKIKVLIGGLQFDFISFQHFFILDYSLVLFLLNCSTTV